MGIIHMEVESVDALVNELLRNATTMQEYVQGLLDAAYALGGAWQGDSTGIYIEELNSVLQHLKIQAGELADLGKRVNNEKEQWVLTAQDFGGDTSVPVVSPVASQGGKPGQQSAVALKDSQNVSIISPWTGQPMTVSYGTAKKIKQLQEQGYSPSQIRDILRGDHTGTETTSNQANSAANGWFVGETVRGTSREFFTGVDSKGNTSYLGIVGSGLLSILPGGKFVVAVGAGAYRTYDLNEAGYSLPAALGRGTIEGLSAFIPGRMGSVVRTGVLAGMAVDTYVQTGSVAKTASSLVTGMIITGAIGAATGKVIGGLTKRFPVLNTSLGDTATVRMGRPSGAGGIKTVIEEPPAPVSAGKGSGQTSSVREGGSLPEDAINEKPTTSGGVKSGTGEVEAIPSKTTPTAESTSQGAGSDGKTGGGLAGSHSEEIPPGSAVGSAGGGGGTKDPPSGSSTPPNRKVPSALVTDFETTVNNKEKGWIQKVAGNLKELKQAEVEGEMGGSSQHVRDYHQAVSDHLKAVAVESVPSEVQIDNKIPVKVKEVHIGDSGSTSKGITSMGSDHDRSLGVKFDDEGLANYAKEYHNGNLAEAHQELSGNFVKTFTKNLDNNFKKRTGASLNDIDAKVYNGLGKSTGQGDEYPPRWFLNRTVQQGKYQRIVLNGENQPPTVTYGSGREFVRSSLKSISEIKKGQGITPPPSEPIDRVQTKIDSEKQVMKICAEAVNHKENLSLKDAAKYAPRFDDAERKAYETSLRREHSQAIANAPDGKPVETNFNDWMKGSGREFKSSIDPEMVKLARQIRDNPQTAPANMTAQQRQDLINYMKDAFGNFKQKDIKKPVDIWGLVH